MALHVNLSEGPSHMLASCSQVIHMWVLMLVQLIPACSGLIQGPQTALPFLAHVSVLLPVLLALITPAFSISFLACKLKPETESHGVSLSYFPSVCLVSVLSVSFMSHSLQNLHQLKQIQTLKQMNEQLQAENRALTRVVARLSKSIESSDTQEL